MIEFPNFSRSYDRTRHDYLVLTDHRAMFAGLFGRMYGLDTTALQRIFTDVRPVELGLV